MAQCGGAGNIAVLHEHAGQVMEREPFATHFGRWRDPWRFDTAEQAAELLAAAGFEAIDCTLEPREVGPDEPHEYLATVCLGHHLDHLPRSLHERFVAAVAETMTDPLELHYVRLNIEAVRP